jgi:hypothetical protein
MEPLPKPGPFGCKCQTLAVKVLGDGCDECSPDMDLLDDLDDLDADHIPNDGHSSPQ